MKRARGHTTLLLFVLAVAAAGILAPGSAAGESFFCQTCSAELCINVHPEDWGWANCWVEQRCILILHSSDAGGWRCWDICHLTESCLLPPPTW